MLDVRKIRKDFKMFESNPDLIYLDNAATTFKPRSVIEAIEGFYDRYNANIGRGEYDIANKAHQEYENTRTKVAKFINASSDKEIIFTSGASGSLNLVASGYGEKILKKGDVILTTYAEHASNILPWFRVAEKTGAIIEYVGLREDGSFDLDDYLAKLNDKVKIVSLAHVSNVLGYIVPLKKIIEEAHRVKAIVNVDGAQSIPHLKTDVRDLDIDFLSFSSHKMLGPSGVGVLYGKMDLLEEMEPTTFGGGSNARFDSCGNIILKDVPYRFESGTPNIEGVIGFGAAIDYLEKIGMDSIRKHDHELREYLMEELKKLDNIVVYNPNAETGIVSFNVKGLFAQDVAAYLNTQKICVRAGNHCAKILVEAIKTAESVRVSTYFYNTKEDIDHLVDVLKDIDLEKVVGTFI